MRSGSLLRIGDDLRLSITGGEARLTPAQGLRAAERLARVAFRAVLSEEAAAMARPAGQVVRRTPRITMRDGR